MYDCNRFCSQSIIADEQVLIYRHYHMRRCVACHPGYGFLSENTDFLSALEECSIAFVGPTADTMRLFSRKHTARQFAREAGIPVLPGWSLFLGSWPLLLSGLWAFRPGDMQLALGTIALIMKGLNRGVPFLQRHSKAVIWWNAHEPILRCAGSIFISRSIPPVWRGVRLCRKQPGYY